MKNINVEEVKRYLKRNLKKKITITLGVVFAFLMSSSISESAIAVWRGSIIDWGQRNKGDINKKSIALNPNEESSKDNPNYSQVATEAVAIGFGAKATGTSSISIGMNASASSQEAVAIGKDTIASGNQGTAIGSKTYAGDQATALGSDVYALGNSSIAIGNDDIHTKYVDMLPNELSLEIFKNLYKDNKAMTEQHFRDKYISTPQYTPTFAGGQGAIAIGSRAIAGKDGSTSIGTLSFALAEGSTALGLRTYVDKDATGGLAVGEESRVFSANSLAVGNKNESTSKGSMSYGYNAKAVGEGSLAIGYKVSANADIKNLDNLKESLKNRNTDINSKMNSINGFEAEYNTESKTEFTISKNQANNVIKKTKTKGSFGVALGSRAYAVGENSMTLGSLSLSEGKNSMAIGVTSYASGENSQAMGANSIATGNNSMALGVNANANLDNSMAIGVSSITDYQKEWLKKPGYAPQGAISMPTSSHVGILSVGSIGQERRITNVAGGYRDTDAVNVAQLRSLEEKLSTVNPDEKESSMINYMSIDKINEGSEGKKIKDIAMKELYYKQYIQLKAKQLEIKVRKEKNKEEFDSDFENKLNAKVTELEGKNIKAINDSKIKKYDASAKINDNTLFTKDILNEISKEKDEDLSDEKLKAVLTDSEKELVKKSNFFNSNATGKDSISVGVYAKSSGEEAIAIGKESDANGKHSVVIGTKNSKSDITDNVNPEKNIDKISGEEDAVAIGHGVDAKKWAVGIGSNVYADNTAVAIGDRAKAAAKFGIAIGEKSNVNSESAIAMGLNSSSKAKNAIAMGSGAISKSENGVAIGQGAIVEENSNDSLAFGNGSKATKDTNLGYLTNAKHDGGEVVSFGGNGKKRRIVNVADGFNDSDAVTIAQLKAVEKKITNISSDEVLTNLEGENGIYVKKDNKANSKKYLIGINDGYIDGKIDNKYNKFETLVNNTKKEINNNINGKYIEFSGDDLNKKVKVTLDKSLQIQGDSKNITVTTDNNALKVALKDEISVNNITIGGKKVTVEGDNIKFGDKTVVTNGDLDKLTLKYKANGNGDNTTKLNEGLNFTNGKNITAKVEDNGIVKYDLNNSLTDIDSIKGGKDKNQSEIKFTNDKGVEIVNGTHNIAIKDGKITGLDTNDKKIEDNKAVSGAMLKDELKKYITNNDTTIVKKTDLDALGFVISDNNNTNGQKISVKDGTAKINFESSILDIDTKEQGKIKFEFNKGGKDKLTKELLTKVPDIKAKEGSPITVDTEEKDGKTTKVIGIDEDKIKTIVNNTELNNYVKNDFSNIKNEGKKVITDLIDVKGTSGEISVDSTVDETTKKKTFTAKLDTKLKKKIDEIGTGSVNKDNTLTVNGGVVYTAIEQAKTDILAKKLVFKGDDEKTVQRALNETLNIKGGATEGTENNIYVKKNSDDTLNIQLAKTLSGITSISINEGPTISNTGIDMNGKTITNLTTGTNDTDAVNKKYVDEHVKEIVKSLADDLKNGKGIHVESNSPMIYVMKDGDKLVKVKKIKDKVYKETDLDESKGNPTPKDNAKELTNEELKKVYIATINPSDKLVTTKTKISNVSEGDINKTSTDAINGSQLAKVLGIDGKDKKIDKDGKIVIKGKDGNDGKSITIIDKIKELDEISSKAITFKGDNTDKTKTIKLGDEIKISSGNTTYEDGKYSGKNLYVKATDNGLNIEMKESPEFKGITTESITIKKGNNKTTILNIDNTTGDLVINKNGDTNNTETIITNKNIGSQTISYKNNEIEGIVALNKGFNFADGTNTKATVTKEGDIAKVTYNLKDTLTGITSIEGKTPNNKTKIEFTDDGLKLNDTKISGLKDADISDNSTEAVTGSQLKALGDKLGIELSNKQDKNINITKIKNEKGDDTNITNNTIVNNIDEVVKAINKGYKFDADLGGEQTNYLGSKISVKKTTEDITETNNKFVGKNIITKISKDNDGNSTINLAFKDKPEFEGVTLGNGDKKVYINVDNSKGDLIIKKGDDGDNETVITNKNIGSQTITYKVNNDTTSSNVSLSEGLTFKGDKEGENIKVSKEEKGIINFNLSNKLTGIESISNGDTKIEINKSDKSVKIGGVTIKEGNVNISNPIDPSNDGDVITKKYFETKINNLKVGDATKAELAKKADKDAKNLDDSDVKAWKEKLGVSNLDLKVEGTTGSYNTTLAEGIKFEKGDIEVTAKDKKLKLELTKNLKDKINSIDNLENVYLKTDASNLTDDGITNLINKLGTGNGKLDNNNKSKLVTGSTLEATLADKGIKFKGDKEGSTEASVKLDGTLNIKGEVVRKEKDKDDKEKELKNILVKTSNEGIELALSKNLYGMNSIEFINKQGNKSTITINDKGDIVINNKNGDNINTSTLITSNNVLDQRLNYRVNNVARVVKPGEELTLKKGLNFVQNENDNIQITDNGNLGDIKFSLNKNLKDIESVGKDDKNGIKFDSTQGKEKVIVKVGDKDLNITADGNGTKISGITEKTVDENYGKDNGEVATRKEVKQVYDKIKEFTDSKDDIEAGISGNTVYTDKDGNELTKAKYTDAEGKVRYKYTRKDGHQVTNKEVVISLKDTNGSTTEGVALANVKSNITGDTDDKVKEFVNDNDNIKKNNAVTVEDLQKVAKASVTKFIGNDNQITENTFGETVKISGEGTDNTNSFKSAKGNIKVERSNDKKGLDIKLSQDLTNMNSIKLGDKVTIDKTQVKIGDIILKTDGTVEGIKGLESPFEYEKDKNGANIGIKAKDDEIPIHVRNGLISKDSKEVVNGSQLYEVKDMAMKANENSTLALGGVANAVAMANLVQLNSTSEYRHNLSAAYGYYGKSHALAIGFSGTNENRNFIYKLSGSVNNHGNLAFGLGAGLMIGTKDKKDDKDNKYAKDRVNELENIIKKQDEKIKDQDTRMKLLEQKLEELSKKIK